MRPKVTPELLRELLGSEETGFSGQVRREVARRLRAVGQALGTDEEPDADWALTHLLAIADALDSEPPMAD